MLLRTPDSRSFFSIVLAGVSFLGAPVGLAQTTDTVATRGISAAAPSDSLIRTTPESDSLPYRIPPPASLGIPSESESLSVSPSESPHESVLLPERTDLLGRDFIRTGSISRGFFVGSNRDATVVSGFRLQFAGPLTEQIRVNAALTDENSPIQPEGTTQSLREVDKVAIDLEGPSFGLTIGDFFYERTGPRSGMFGSVSRKLQGVTGRVAGETPGLSGIETSVGVVGASSRAVYHTIVIRGIEGVQGPYRLTGKGGEQYIVIVAGSERISINGEPMVRGETNDYIIDYATGEITFTSGRMITSDSRIYVDFEYAERGFSRNVVGADVAASIDDGSLDLHMSVLQEADDPDNPVGGPLDASTLALLRQSGDDPLKASVSGVRFVGRDSSTGRPLGQYLLRDSTFGGSLRSILVYAPGDQDAVYSVTFSRIPSVPRDSVGYRRIQGGEYRVAGVGAGTHVPRVFAEIPRLHRNVTGGVSARLSDIEISMEGSRSVVDRNRLSAVDDIIPAGDAYDLRLSYVPERISLFGTQPGNLRIDLEQRYVAEEFAAFGRIDPVEYRRTWDLEDVGAASELRRQVSVRFSPVPLMKFNAYLGGLVRSDGIDARRNLAGVQINDGKTFDVSASAERLTRNNERTSSGSVWNKYIGDAGGRVSLFRPGVGLRIEDRLERSDTTGDVLE